MVLHRRQLSFSWGQSGTGSSVLFLFIAVSIAGCEADGRRWVTVLAQDNKSSAHSDSNVYELLMHSGPVNDVEGRENQEPYQAVAVGGKFRSGLIDEWSIFRPRQVRVILYDKAGYPLWFVVFDETGAAGTDPDLWALKDKVKDSSDIKVMNSDISILVFNNIEMKLQVQRLLSPDIRLHLTWSPATGSGAFVFVATYEVVQPPLTLQSYPPHRDMVDSGLSQSYRGENKPNITLLGIHSGFTMLFAGTSYLVGMSVKKNVSMAGEVTQFKMSVSIETDCYHTADGYLTIYPPGTTDPVFTAIYDHGSNNSYAAFVFEDVVAARCMNVVVVARNSSDPDQKNLFIFYETERTVLEAPIFALQWSNDSVDVPEVASPTTTITTSAPEVKTECEKILVCTRSVTPQDEDMDKKKQEIVNTLHVPKAETSKFKRKFVSVPDERPSARAMGAAGVACISLVVLSVIVLDFRLIKKHLTEMSIRLKHLLPRTAPHHDHQHQHQQQEQQPPSQLPMQMETEANNDDGLVQKLEFGDAEYNV